jgi:hypothetical protein
MAKRYQRGNQKPYIEEGHTIRYPIIGTRSENIPPERLLITVNISEMMCCLM